MLLYQWLTIIHIIAIISWMAGLLYLPRLFIYHIQAPESTQEIFCKMERRLLKIIMNPAMLVALITGLIMAIQAGYFQQGWFHAKLTLILFMIITHMMMGRYRRQLETGTCKKSIKFFKFFNEIPTILMIFIVILVVIQPF